MGCSSNKAENTVISKEEREEILNKTTDEIFAANEMRIIELESKNILDFLTLKMPKTHSSYIEYFLYFISSLQENLFNINKKKEAKQLDSQALKLIRINLQKIQELIKTDSNFHEIKEDSRNGSILTKILQEFETNIKVIIKGNLVILISKAMLKEKEGKFSKEFSFILSSSFWLESQNIEKLEIYNYFMNWSDFKRNFIEFSDRNWKISLNEKELALLLKTTDVKNERKIHYKDWDSFYKDKWVHWIKRSQFFEEAKAMEPIKEYNTIEKIDKETTNLDINESDIVSIETKKLSIEQNGKSNNLNTIIIEIKKEESEESNSKAFELNKQDSNYFFQEKMDEKLHERTNNSKSISYNQKKEPKIEIKNEENIHKKSEDSPKQKLVHFQKNELKESQNTNFIDKNHEKSTKIENLEKVTQQENKSTNKLKKSNTVRISDKNAYVKSQGKYVSLNR